MEKSDLLRELLIEDGGILIKLRFGDGVDYDKVDKVKILLNELAQEWEEKDSIPKQACDIFVDFYPAVEGTLSLYDDNNVKKEIMKNADEIMDLIRTCICND